MDIVLLVLFCCCIGFIAGYGVREVISLRRRLQERKMREAHERLISRPVLEKRTHRARKPVIDVTPVVKPVVRSDC